jgi:hypothetical protein
MARQSSGLVKKGKFVRALMDALEQTPGLSTKKLFLQYGQDIGPTLDYVQTNLDKLVASKEVLEDNGTYRLNREDVPSEDLAPQAVIHKAPKALLLKVKSPDGTQELGEHVVRFDEPKPESLGNTPQPIITKEVFIPIKGKLPRNQATEQILSTYWLQMGSGGVFDAALSHYEATHKAKSQITPFKGKLGGDRLTFADTKE